jgi:hypothetical protein
LDRYGYEFERYVRSKFRIAENQAPEDYLIYDGDDEVLASWLEKSPVQSRLFPFSLERKLKEGASIKGNKIEIKTDTKTISMTTDNLAFKRREFTLSWNEAKGIDWGTILLFGGGLALGDLMFSTGLAEWLGSGLAHQLQAHSTLGLVALFTAVAIFLSETTSNTASATMVVPVAMAVSEAAGVNPLQPALAATLGASMGFMLPVSTPPNAIVYGTGCVPLLRMVKYGVVLDVFGSAMIIGVVMWLV